MGTRKASNSKFSERILSRKSSVGCSSRMHYYFRDPEGIPFNWEVQPGKPKNPPKEENIPPISPPPAMLSLGLPKPCANVEEPKPSVLFKLKFWKYLHCKKYLSGSKNNSNKDDNLDRDTISKDGSDRFLDFERCRSGDGESIVSSARYYCSSSSWSSSCDSAKSSKQKNPTKDLGEESYGCAPWSFRTNPVIVRVSRKE